MFTDKTIRNKVMAVVEARIQKGQQDYQKGVEVLEQEHEKKVEKLANDIVKGIIGPLA